MSEQRRIVRSPFSKEERAGVFMPIEEARSRRKKHRQQEELPAGSDKTA